MSNIGNRYKIGVFVIFSMVLLVISLLCLGILNYFKPKYEFMTIVDSSVQGLEKGAKVKLKGVTIGKVTEIKISDQGEIVLIYMNFTPTAVSVEISDEMSKSVDPQKKFEKLLHEGIQAGLRCQLRYEGITGNLYQEITYFDPKKYPPKPDPVPGDDIPYIPSAPPVLMENLLTKIENILDKINKIDIEKIGTDVDSLLITTNKLLNNDAIEKTLEQIQIVSKDLSEISNIIKDNFESLTSTPVLLKARIK